MLVKRNQHGSHGRGTSINPDAAARETGVQPDAAPETHTQDGAADAAAQGDAPAVEATEEATAQAEAATDEPASDGQLQRGQAGTIPPPYSLADVRNLLAGPPLSEERSNTEQWHLWGYDERKDALAAFKEAK